MAYNRILEKQINRFLPASADTSQFNKLLEAVSNYYDSQERDKRISEHAFNISEKEYQEATQNLKEQNQIKHQSIEKIKEVLMQLDQKYALNPETHDDLTALVDYLSEQVEKSKKLKVQLQVAKEEAESLARAKGNFLSVMSHEIRTPLNAIIGGIHLLKEENHLPVQEPLINTLQISSDNLLSLVNDILDFSKIDEGKIELAERELNLATLMRNVADTHAFSARESQNTLTLTLDPALPSVVLGDEVRLSQILNNLVANAIKFTSQGFVEIKAEVLADNEHSSRIRFTINDSGIGIAKEKQKIIFERFTQANSEIDRKYGGSGLGLTIIKKLLERFGSNVQLVSEPGKGSSFFFELNFKKCLSHGHKTSAATTIKQDISGVRILMAEDVEFNVIMAERMLTNWNAVVDIASNGAIAVEKCRTFDYDIILMDIQMPVMDGISAAKAIRTFNKDIPIIALSASAANEIVEDIHAAGMNVSVPKPFNPSHLFKTILQWTKGRSSKE